MAKDSENPFDTTRSLRAKVARKRSLADAMMALGLKGSGQNYVHPMQVVAQLAQALVANRLDKRASLGEEQIYDMRREQANADMAIMLDPNSTPEEKAGAQARSGDAMPGLVTKPAEAAAVKRAVPDWDVQGGVVYNQNDYKPGQIVAQDPNRQFMRTERGIEPNVPKIQTDLAIGAATGGYPITADEGSGIPAGPQADPFRPQPPQPSPGMLNAPVSGEPTPAELDALSRAGPEQRTIILEILRKDNPEWFAKNFGGQ